MEIVYLLQPAELVETDIYKVGHSLSEEIARCKNGYKKGTRYICIIKCNDAKMLETKIKNHFKIKFKLMVGQEYFRGTEFELQSEFLIFVFNHLKIENIIKDNNIEDNIKDNIEDNIKEINIYETFLNDCTKESDTHVSTVRLYMIFQEWFRKNYDNDIMPNNRGFLTGIRKYKNVKRGLWIDAKSTTGIKNIKIIKNTF
jgi:hypothetical protein